MSQTICVCGAGTMGAGIAQLAAQHGFHTILYDVQLPVLEKAKTDIQKSLRSLADKNKIPAEEIKTIFDRLHFTTAIDDCKANIIIEAIVERPDAKINLFNQLASINSAETILATNTSSLSVSQIAQAVIHPERVAGMHFFNPAPVMKLVEVVKGKQTSSKTIEAIVVLAQKMNKVAVLCNDAPGFIVNHVARPYYIESLRLVEHGFTDFATIDTLLESAGFKLGPFKLMDLIGNDVNYAVSCSVYEQLNTPVRLRPSYLQEEKVKKGELGKKTGQGYYKY